MFMQGRELSKETEILDRNRGKTGKSKEFQGGWSP